MYYVLGEVNLENMLSETATNYLWFSISRSQTSVLRNYQHLVASASGTIPASKYLEKGKTIEWIV